MQEGVAGHGPHGRTEDEPNMLLNAGIGAIVTVVTAPILPFAAIVGGGIAGYLQGGDLQSGATAGAIAGAIASIPVGVLVWFLFGVALLGVAPAPLSLLAALLFGLLVGYLVGAGALGGTIGAYVHREF